MSALDGWIDVCRTGTWQDSSGKTVSLNRRDFDGYVAAHAASDPAPVVVGHPKMDSPAWAWVDGMRRAGDRLQVKLRNIQPAFREAVEGGQYSARSVALEAGRVRHVGFLGGKAPAVPGLAPTQFNAEPDHVIELAEAELASGSKRWAFRSLARVLRGIREHIIETKDQETADRVIPDWEIEAVSELADEDEEVPAAAMAGAEPETTIEEDPMSGTPDLDARTAELDAREARLSEREAAAARASTLAAADAMLDEHVQAGRVLPAERAGLAALLASFPDDDGDATVLTFAAPEGDGEVKKQPRTLFSEFLAGLPKRVEFAELAGGRQPPAQPQDSRFELPAGMEADPGGMAVHNRAVELAAERDIPYIEAARIAAQGG